MDWSTTQRKVNISFKDKLVFSVITITSHISSCVVPTAPQWDPTESQKPCQRVIAVRKVFAKIRKVFAIR